MHIWGMPRGCFVSSIRTAGGIVKPDFPNPSGGGFTFDLIQWIGKETMNLFDVSQTVAGDEMEGASN